MTVQDWLAIPEDKLPTALAEALIKKPWKHEADIDRYGFGDCKKCGDRLGQKRSPEHCPVPDPITIDWNTAMEWRDKAAKQNLEAWEEAVNDVTCFEHGFDSYERFWDTFTQPKHYLIAATIAAERKEE